MQEKIVFPKLGVLVSESLKDQLAEYSVAYDEETIESGGHGELATMAIVAGATAALAVAVGAWLLKTRTGDDIEMTWTKRLPDGTEEHLTFRHTIRDEKEPSAEVIAALKDAFGVGLIA